MPSGTNKVHDKIQETVRDGILTSINHSRRTTQTPLVPVLKSDEWVRICGDYKDTLNTLLSSGGTASQIYTLPNLYIMLFKLAQCTVFSKLDLAQASLQLPFKRV